jgi:hypothetical protein
MFEDANDECVSAGAEVVSQAAFDLAAETFAKPDDFRLFGDCGHTLIAELLEDVMAYRLQEFARPAVAGYRHMDIGTLEAIEDAAADNASALFDAKGSEWREQSDADPIAHEADHSVIHHDHDRISPLS